MRHGSLREDLDGLADLVAVDAVKTVLRHYHKQAGGKPNAFAVGIASTLIHIARYHVRVPEEQLQRAEEDRRQAAGGPLRPHREEQGAAGGARERAGAGQAALPAGGADAGGERRSSRGGRRLKFVEAQVAVAVDILLCRAAAPAEPDRAEL